MKKILSGFVIFLIGGVSILTAQYNDIIDLFLEDESADTLISAYLVLFSAGVIGEEAGPEGAADYLGTYKWGDRLLKEDSITYGGFSLLLMKVLQIRGGLFFTLFPLPRYAAREFSSLGMIPGKRAPGSSLTPFEVLAGLNAALNVKKVGL
ncbi:MAG: hypothetical protein JEY99_02965 [Spirochaetales bacterium]|nr:hypothetical protein [Spirochaetales bacterium]